MNKKAQLYLLAAILICLGIYGAIKINNKLVAPSDTDFSFYVDNFKGERTQVINLGYIQGNQGNIEDPNLFLKTFAELGWNTGIILILKKDTGYDIINYLNEPITICPSEGECVVESGALESGGTLNFGFGEGKTIKIINQNIGDLTEGAKSFTVLDLPSIKNIIVENNIYPINNPESTQTIIFKDIDENFKKVEIV